MKNYLLMTIIALFAISFTACDDDDDNIETPYGIIIMNPAIECDNNGELNILFRTNPSNYAVNTENLVMDCVYSNVTGRSVTTTPPDNFELVEVKALTDESGTAREGEWIATVKVKEGDPYEEYAQIYLVLNYQNANGQTVSITSSNYAAIRTFPPLSDAMISFSNPTAQSYKSSVDNQPLYSRIYITPNILSENSNIPYNLALIKNSRIRLTGDFADYFQYKGGEHEDYLTIDIIPDHEKMDKYFSEHPDVNSIEASVDIAFMDRAENVLIKTIKTSFFRSIMVIPATDKFTFTKANLNQGVDLEFNLDMGTYLPQLGITKEFLENHPDRSFTVECSGYMADGSVGSLGFGFDGTSLDNDKNYLETGKFNTSLDIMMNDADFYKSGSYYAVLRFVIVDPNTMHVMICGDIRQEIKIVD